MSRPPVYLDYHATTPVDRRVLERMLPYFTETFGNPASSTHQWGWKAQEAVEQARREVSQLIGASPREIYFTSGATESNNLAMQGACALADASRRHLVVSAIEHKSVLEAAERMERRGWRCTVVPVDRDGVVDLAAVEAAVGPETAYVSVMAANNEIGVVQPLAEIGAIARRAGAVFHVDAAQAAGKIPLDVTAMQIDVLALTGHKMYGPKGAGAIFVRKQTRIEPLIVGGGQERGMRSGTLNVPGIVGLGAACEICRTTMAEESPRLAALRDRLLKGLTEQLPGVTVNGSLERRLPHNLHVSFADVDGESLLIGISDIAVSSGSACSSASGTASHVLRAIMGGNPVPSASIRFGLGRHTTEEDIDYTIGKFVSVIRHLRSTAPVH
ncbi:MAG TPA: cysteine desulfurase family protein [Vicinamibacterales bacterium]|nr:cysteine desulfurase family protein [Vicinamibacterales bacterium]